MKKLLLILLFILVFTGIKAQSNYEQLARNIIENLNLTVAIGPIFNANQDSYLLGANVPSNQDYSILKSRINEFLNKYRDIKIIRSWEWNDSQSYSLMISKLSIKHQVTLYISYFPVDRKLVFVYK